MASTLPLDTRFRLGPAITPEQRGFLETHGFLHFEGVLRPEEVALVGEELERVEQAWLAEGRTRINGIPLFFGIRPDGGRGIQRFAFTSLFSEPISRIVRDPRFEPIGTLVGEGARVGEREKDGVVVNRFLAMPGSVADRLGWHTDGLRDLFYLRMPLPMLNVGVHLDECTADNGGLRLIPGSHTQGFLSMCFRKPYFVWHRPDPAEFCVETRPGDLTVHDGRLWHRVARSTRTGAASHRRSMYVPYLTGPYEPKTETSRTPGYHRMGALLRTLKTARPLARVGAALLAAGVFLAVVLASRQAAAGGYWNFDKGVTQFGRGGANIAAPEDPIAVYTNPAALAGHRGFRFVLDLDMAWDDRAVQRVSVEPRRTGFKARPMEYQRVENDWPEWPPSPSFFASWNAADIGAPRLTLGAALYGPPRSDTRFPAGGPQRYQVIETHNLQIQSALAAGYELPWKRLRVGATAMSINQVIRSRLAFPSFFGPAEDPGWDAEVMIQARDEFIPAFTFGGSIEPVANVTFGTSVQLPYDVHAKGRIDGSLGEDLEAMATLRPGGVRVHTRMPAIARGAVRYDAPSGLWNAEAAIVWEGWSRNREVLIEADQPGGLALLMDDGSFGVGVGEVRIATHFRDTFSLRTGGELAGLPGGLTLRGGVFYERAAIAPDRIHASNFDLDKVGLVAGGRVPLPRRAWLDLTAGYQHWFPVRARDSRVRIHDPISGEKPYVIGNGDYENRRIVAMAGLGLAFGGPTD